MEESLSALVRQRIFLLPAGWGGLNTCRASVGDLQPLCHLCPATAPFVPSSPGSRGCWNLPHHNFGRGYGLDPKQLWGGSRQHHLPELAAPAPHQHRQPGLGKAQMSVQEAVGPFPPFQPALREPASSLSMFHTYTHDRYTSFGLWPPKCTQLVPKTKSLMVLYVLKSLFSSSPETGRAGQEHQPPTCRNSSHDLPPSCFVKLWRLGLSPCSFIGLFPCREQLVRGERV